MSSFSGSFEHYAPWKTIDGREVVTNLPALEVAIKGVFDQRRLLDILQNFVVFSEETVTDKKSGQKIKALIKRVAKYHQYWAVNAAVESTVTASRRRTATGVVASSGTPRAPARASRWSSTPPRSCVTLG